MKHLLFSPTISYWQWLTMSLATFAAYVLSNEFSGAAWLGILVIGAAIEGIAYEVA